MKYEECWTVLRVRVSPGPDGTPALELGRALGAERAPGAGRAPEPTAAPTFAAARLARGGTYGPRWQVIGWLQDAPTDHDQAFHHGVSVHGERAFARALFPEMRRRSAPAGE